MLYIRTVLHTEDAKSDQVILATIVQYKNETWMLLGLGIIYLFIRF